MSPPQKTHSSGISLLIVFCARIFLTAYLAVLIINLIVCGYNGYQMEYCSPKLVVYWSCTYKVMPAVAIGDNKRLYESHPHIKNFHKHDVHQPKNFTQTVLIYAVPIPPNLSETGIPLGNTMLNTSSYTLSHGIQEQTSHDTSASRNNSTDITTNGTNEETVQASVTNDSRLNNSRRLPTNDIQENTSQNTGTGYEQMNTSVDSIDDELQAADRTPASADTETVTGTGTCSYRSRDEPDPTLADQLRLVTLRENTWLSCLLRETEMEQCDRSLDVTSSTETGNLAVSSSKSHQKTCEIECENSNELGKSVSRSVLSNVAVFTNPKESTNGRFEAQDQRPQMMGGLKKPLQERKVRPSPRISKQERRFNEKGMKNEDKDTKKGVPKERSTNSNEDAQNNIAILRTSRRTTEEQPTSCSTSQEQSVMKGAATLNVKDDQSKESVKEDS